MANSPGALPPTGCLFFDKLAPELRNSIYELAFTPDHNDEEVDFFAPSPPTKALLSICRQMNNETRQIYRDAYRSYWRSSEFFVSENTIAKMHGPWPANKDVSQIRRFRLTGLTNLGRRYRYILVDSSGIWCMYAAKPWGEVATWISCHFKDGQDSVPWATREIEWTEHIDELAAAAHLQRHTPKLHLLYQIEDLLCLAGT